MKYFVYGASGGVGKEVASLLLNKGESVVGSSRKPSLQKSENNLSWIEVNTEAPEKGIEALHGVDKVFLMSPPGHMDQYTLLKPWIDESKKKGIKKIVLMTAMGIEHAPPEVPFRKLELYLESSGIDYIIVRPNWFMQNFQTSWLSGIKKDRKIYFPGGSAKVSFIDSIDIAKSVVGAFEDSIEKNRGYMLTGREAIDHSEVADLLSKVTGITISYEDISSESFVALLLNNGVKQDYANFLAMIAGSLKEGHSIAITGDVKYLSGKEPTKFEEYAKENASIWK
ncbi:MAG: nucleoside-diphosphate sugar epimerase [Spirochaetia bacterium]|nr:nucleoside-diphosphate sugar epimerase [Spirochaetia bacterium]